MGFLLTCAYADCRHAARKRGLPFELTFEDWYALTQRNCYLCGSKPSRKLSRTGKSQIEYVNGIDRVDNSLGYVAGNVEACCKTCNFIKRTLPLEELKTHIKKMLRRLR